MMLRTSPHPPMQNSVASKRRGFSLVEVTAALGIVTTTLLLLVGLVPTGVQSNADTFEETQASNLASLIIADFRGCGTTGNSPMFGINVNSYRSTGSGSETLYFSETFDESATEGSHASGLSSRYRAELKIDQPVAGDKGGPLEVNLTITWPAQLDPADATDRNAINGVYSMFFTVPNPDAYAN